MRKPTSKTRSPQTHRLQVIRLWLAVALSVVAAWRGRKEPDGGDGAPRVVGVPPGKPEAQKQGKTHPPLPAELLAAWKKAGWHEDVGMVPEPGGEAYPVLV